VFKGSIQSGSTISGATITGGIIRTANESTTPRIELASTSANNMFFYGSATAPGTISVTSHTLFFYPPGSSIGSGANMQIYGNESSATPNGIFLQGGTSTALTFSMSSTTIALNQGTHGVRIRDVGVVIDGAADESTEAVRNVRITQTEPTSGASSSTTNGTILLVREA
jgi:hypothetical protein